jgi:hypothetical protein
MQRHKNRKRTQAVKTTPPCHDESWYQLKHGFASMGYNNIYNGRGQQLVSAKPPH